MNAKRLLVALTLGIMAFAIPRLATAQVSSNDLFAEVGVTVPQFAGLSVDQATGGLILYAAPPYDGIVTDVKVAVAQADPTFLETYSLDVVRVVEVQYTFVQLNTWYERLRSSVWGIDGVALVSIRVKANSILVTVEDPRTQGPAVRQEAERYDIPADALAISSGSPVAFSSTRPQDSLQSWTTIGLAGLVLVVGLTSLLVHRKNLRHLQVPSTHIA